MSIKFGVRTYTTNAKACRSLLKLQKTKLFHLYYMHYCMTKFRTKKKKKNILHKHSQNKYLFKHFYFFHFNSTQFRFCFLKNTNADICKAICFK